MSNGSGSALRFYNPDWLSDDDLVAGFIARRDLFGFLRDELERAPLRGNIQHYLLVGVRGSGKTSLLKRLSVAIRRDAALSEHLIGLSFPEELYEVKGLSDFWWAACTSLVDALDRTDQHTAADRLAEQIEVHATQSITANPHDDAGLRLLLQTCAVLQRRPVLLVDNLDLVLKRIDKTGRKLKDPQSHAYWALREALSTIDAPLMIGGSVRLSEPFVGHDNAFYDYFIPQRLGKLSLEEVRETFDHLARNHCDAGDQDNVQQRIRERPGRMRALYELTGGNPRALGLIFELLRQGPNSSAVDAFEQLLDLTTPYYKARFEELAEQAQVVMHALALSKRDHAKGTFGHTAAAIAQRAGLETRIVSAQLDGLVNEGVVEKSSGSRGRTQYRIAEQLFRLWLQMRGSRRIRQQVIGLTEFLEALFDRDEHEKLIQDEVKGPHTASLRSRAKMSLALSELQHETGRRHNLQTRAADAMLQAGATGDGSIDGAFGPGDLPGDIGFLYECRNKLQSCASWHRNLRPDATVLTRDLLGALRFSAEEKRASVARLCDRSVAADEFARLEPLLAQEREALQRDKLSLLEIDLLYTERVSGRLTLPRLTPADLQLPASATLTSLAWKLLGARRIAFGSIKEANAWIAWGKRHFAKASSVEWAAVARAMRLARHLDAAESATELALRDVTCSRAWFERGALLDARQGDPSAAETAFRRACELDPADAWPWNNLGILLTDQLKRHDEAEEAFRKAIDLDPADVMPWNNLGILLTDQLKRHDEAEEAFRKAIDLGPTDALPWANLGNLLTDQLKRHDDAQTAYRKAIDLDPTAALPWNNLGVLLTEQFKRHDHAEAAFRKAIELDPGSALPWNNLGILMDEQLGRIDDAEAAFRKAIDLNPAFALPWRNLGLLLHWKLERYPEAAVAYTNSLKLDPKNEMAASQLKSLRQRIFMTDLSRATETCDWSAVRELLSAGIAVAERGSKSWLVSQSFVEDLVRRSLQHGHGAQLLTILREVGFDTVAAPLMIALDAAIDGGMEKLSTVEPEARAAALTMYKRLDPASPPPQQDAEDLLRVE